MVDKVTVEQHEEMETEGGLQTICILEDREYLSLSSWMMEEGVEWWRRREEMKEEREMSEIRCIMHVLHACVCVCVTH